MIIIIIINIVSVSGGSISEVDRRALVGSCSGNGSSSRLYIIIIIIIYLKFFQNPDMPMSTTFQGGLRYASYSPHLRRSLPTLSHMSNEPPKIYPYHLLVITNYRLPADVDRCNLEVRKRSKVHPFVRTFVE